MTALLPKVAKEFVIYSSNKIRKTQIEHRIIVFQNLIGLYLWIYSKFLAFCHLHNLLFDLETIGVSQIIIW